jgi:diguanylate cyclase (GGDEF)-like protein
VLYTVLNLFAAAVVVAAVQGTAVRAMLLSQPGHRVLTWSVAVAVGLSSAYAALHAPAALVGIGALLVVVSVMAHALQHTEREVARLSHLLDANTRIQTTSAPQVQEHALLEVARDLLLWRDVRISDAPPVDNELGAPISRGTNARWLIAAPRTDSDPWNDEDFRIIEALASAAAFAFDRAALQAQLERLAMADPLTGVANRRRFDEALQDIDRHAGYGVVVVDLDGFKDVNDRLGHEAGDELLQAAAGRLAACVRSEDVVARLGGDEFAALIAPIAEPGAVERVASLARSKFAEPVHIADVTLTCVPCSVGIAASPGDGTEPRDVLRAADRAMYRAKARRGVAEINLEGGVPLQQSRGR